MLIRPLTFENHFFSPLRFQLQNRLLSATHSLVNVLTKLSLSLSTPSYSLKNRLFTIVATALASCIITASICFYIFQKLKNQEIEKDTANGVLAIDPASFPNVPAPSQAPAPTISFPTFIPLPVVPLKQSDLLRNLHFPEFLLKTPIKDLDGNPIPVKCICVGVYIKKMKTDRLVYVVQSLDGESSFGKVEFFISQEGDKECIYIKEINDKTTRYQGVDKTIITKTHDCVNEAIIETLIRISFYYDRNGNITIVPERPISSSFLYKMGFRCLLQAYDSRDRKMVTFGGTYLKMYQENRNVSLPLELQKILDENRKVLEKIAEKQLGRPPKNEFEIVKFGIFLDHNFAFVKMRNVSQTGSLVENYFEKRVMKLDEETREKWRKIIEEEHQLHAV